ncbi:MAG: hypothetical protein LQ349_003613 [Xanthoria aureola]|nr:MAG: hypothetical protein LQ349_003613 [Xanthoria aureola]
MTDHPPGPNAALASSFRQDLWPSRRAAEEALSKNKLFRSFHPKVLENYVRHGLRELPTQVYPDLPADYIAGAPRPVTLTTSKHQEVWTFIRSNFLSRGPVVDDGLRSTEQQDRVINPNADPETEVPLRFYRPECTITFKNLPYVRPTTYYIFGAKSPFSPPEARKEKQDQTGTGVGGSGGVQAGKVQSHVFENGNHFLPFVNVEALAEVVNVYLEQGLHNTVKEDTLWKNFDSQKSERDRLVVSKRWLEAVGQPTDAKRSVVSKL